MVSLVDRCRYIFTPIVTHTCAALEWVPHVNSCLLPLLLSLIHPLLFSDYRTAVSHSAPKPTFLKDSGQGPVLPDTPRAQQYTEKSHNIQSSEEANTQAELLVTS